MYGWFTPEEKIPENTEPVIARLKSDKNKLSTEFEGYYDSSGWHFDGAGEEYAVLLWRPKEKV